MSNELPRKASEPRILGSDGHAIGASETERSLSKLLPSRACVRFTRLSILVQDSDRRQPLDIGALPSFNLTASRRRRLLRTSLIQGNTVWE